MRYPASGSAASILLWIYAALNAAMFLLSPGNPNPSQTAPNRAPKRNETQRAPHFCACNPELRLTCSKTGRDVWRPA